MSAAGLHLLVIPYPAQGHLIPLLDLTHQLASRLHLAVTIVVTPQNHPLLSPLLAASPSIQPLLLPFPKHPSIPDGVENAKDLPPSSFTATMQAFGSLRRPILDWARAHPSPPHAVLSDFFLGWTHHLAADLGIPRVVFSPSGALALSVIYHLWRRMPRRPDDPDLPVPFPEIPGVVSFPWRQLSPVFRSYREGDETSEFIKDGMLANLASWGLVLNTFDELEGAYLDHLSGLLGHPRVWAVGPILPAGAVDDRGGSSSVPTEDLMSWLDRWPEGSVVFVCFGSQAVLSAPQAAALASGLEDSGAAFVWCVRDYARGGAGVVPAGFEESVAGRGRVIKGWAPQVAILRHESVGVFLSHCGWNSVLEGLTAGVSFLTWAMGADQFTNARLLAEELGVGVRVCEGAKAVPDSAELARAVAESVGGWRREKGRAKQLRDAALAAAGEGGSSVKALESLAAGLVGRRNKEEKDKKTVC